jgi:hypothetical protein
MQLGTTFTTKAQYTNTQSSILMHSKWQKKHSSTNGQIATSTPTKIEQVSSGLHSAAAAADDDMSCQVLALSRNTSPFIIRGSYCKSGTTKPTTTLCYSVLSTLICNCHASGNWLAVHNLSLSVTDSRSDLTQVMSSEAKWRSNTKLQTLTTCHSFCLPLTSLKKHFHHFQTTVTTRTVKCFLGPQKNRSCCHTAVRTALSCNTSFRKLLPTNFVFVSCYQQMFL